MARRRQRQAGGAPTQIRQPWLGRVDILLHPYSSRDQVQKTQVTMCVFIVAGGHAPPRGARPCHPVPRGPAKTATHFIICLYTGPEGAGWKDEAVADALDVAGAGPRAGGTGGCVPHQLRDSALHTKKRTDDLMSGAAVLSAGAAGGGRSGAGSLQPALRCALSGDLPGRATPIAAGRQAAAATGAPGTSCHLRLRIRAAQHLHPLDVRGAAGPMAHGQRYRPAHGRGLGASGAGPRIIRATARPSA